MKLLNTFALGLLTFFGWANESHCQSNYLFDEGLVVVKGQISNAQIKTILLTNLELTGRVQHAAKLDSLGNFEFKFNILSPHDNYLIYNGKIATLFTAPGDTLMVTADDSDFEKTITFSGANANFNQSLKLFSEEFGELLESKEFFVKKRDLPPNEFKSFASDFFGIMETKIDSIITITNPKENVTAWMRNYVKYRLAEDLIEYGLHHKDSLTADYYSFESDFLQTGKFDWQCSQYYDDFIGKYHLGYKLSQFEGFTEVISKYREQSYEGLTSTFRFVDEHIKDNKVKNFAITQFCNAYIESNYTIVDSAFSTYSTFVSDVTCQNFILQRIESKKTYVPLVNDLDDLSSLEFIGEIFQEIQNDFPDKVLYIDIWGPTCGSCIRAFPYSNKLYEELDKDKIEFIYLCISSEKGDWQKIVDKYNMQGRNYLLTRDQSIILSEKLNVYGIPRYVMIDKKGKIVDQKAKGPYIESLKTELLKLAEM
ncbi:TlpA disulfide reductase family protein [Flammeovirgaceae bacterium SG7u.111]|nr:TlpA disulfide reductase family protein [Flammeovirgaceae bacterium SG7u.132]WPO37845.1 TlpA disulfide reductase family protein [Flammeovirgaceae bacterium SG7u.111]